MTISSDGQLCFGVLVPNGERMLPWEESPYDGDCDDWVCDLNGLGDAEFDEQRAFVKSLPVEFRTHCSYDYPEWIAAVPGTFVNAYRGRPKNLGMFIGAIPEERVHALYEFLDQYGIEYEKPAGWILSSMYG